MREEAPNDFSVLLVAIVKVRLIMMLHVDKNEELSKFKWDDFLNCLKV